MSKKIIFKVKPAKKNSFFTLKHNALNKKKIIIVINPTLEK